MTEKTSIDEAMRESFRNHGGAVGFRQSRGPEKNILIKRGEIDSIVQRELAKRLDRLPANLRSLVEAEMQSRDGAPSSRPPPAGIPATDVGTVREGVLVGVFDPETGTVITREEADAKAKAKAEEEAAEAHGQGHNQ